MKGLPEARRKARHAAPVLDWKTMNPTEPNAVVLHKLVLATDSFILRVAPEGWELPQFKAGQYTTLGLPAVQQGGNGRAQKLVRRAYSICSSPEEKTYLEFYIRLVAAGALTPNLAGLKTGDRVFLGPKIAGTFTLDAIPPEANLVMIATGTGIAPFMSIVRTHLAASGKKMAILHGCRHSWDLGYRDELLAMQRLSGNLYYCPVLDMPEKEPVPWKGRTGFVQGIWKSGAIEQAWGVRLTPDNTHAMLCGNPLMIESMTKVLLAEGYKEHTKAGAGQIHTEKYW